MTPINNPDPRCRFGQPATVVSYRIMSDGGMSDGAAELRGLKPVRLDRPGRLDL